MTRDFSQDVAAVGDIKAVPTMLDIVCRATGMRFAAVARVTEDRWIACSVRDDIAFGLTPGGELQVETTFCHKIRQSGQAIVIDNVAQDATYCRHHTPSIYGLQSYISVPIRRADGSFFGTLCAIDPEPHRLNTPETIRMFELFADIIGYHLTAIDRLSASEETLLDERKVAALREQFIAVLGHDLRNPLAAIDSGTRLLLKTPLNDKATSLVGMIRSSVGRMAGLIDDVMDFARGRLGGGLSLNRKHDEPLETILRQVVAELQVSAPNRTIETEFDLPASVHCDGRRIAQLVSNLLGNALTHGAADRPVRVRAVVAGAELELSVANAGDPIPPAVLEGIFQPFARGTHRPDLGGLGLGLYIAHQIAQAHGGRIDVTSTAAETRFTFRMPLST
ncbi:GAF domain-containing sensor histidine kinase [Paracraurococcus ruber]|uniref:histidine kinase n=1 Tax=Paracraurococcus ruber TaxID=77675 RepID=A0ABS1D0E0_9PROT|nr:GAF domain-containing sensor histidine kinase [Paracraurococcus ruber]MBK1659988.1 histidine kinase [Paracraurococcus ruber]TDG27354.1 GAF domain-containing sensor histidine kinase [Paracraurococcus ruber]